MKLLIAESGSTKTDWVLVSDHGEQAFKTKGINPQILSLETIQDIIGNELLGQLEVKEIDTICFYGAGCSSPDRQKIISDILSNNFNCNSITVEHDLLAAARACSQNEKGITCILGTGSNTCLYNGANIELNIGGYGYILGDEGSGAHLGKLLMKAYLNQSLDSELIEALNDNLSLGKEKIFKNVYKYEAPNQYLASFAPFIAKHKTRQCIKEIINQSFQSFVEQHLMHYPRNNSYDINFVGSVAHHFRDELELILNKNGFKMGKVVQQPITELIQYHKQQHGLH